MKLSTRAHYGLRAVVAIAKLAKNGEPVSVNDIATSEGLSDTYLEQLVSKLRRAGILRSYRGARGGYELVKDPDSITVTEVLEAAGEKLVFPECTTEEGCVRAKDSGAMCPSGCFWTDLCRMVDRMTEENTVGSLIRRQEELLRKKNEERFPE